MGRRINVGIIGCGSIANNYFIPACMSIPEVGIIGVADVDEARASQTASKFNIDKWFSDYRDLLAVSGLDAVTVCTPNYAHCEPAVLAAEAGKHVMVAKPMALNLEECDRMIRAAKKANVKLFVCHMHRFFPECLKAKELLGERLVGDVWMTRIRNGVWGAYRKWWLDPEKTGAGALTDVGIHGVDLMRWFVGDVKSVYAIGDTFISERPSEGEIMTVAKDVRLVDTAGMVYRYRNAAIGVHDVSWNQKAGYARFSAEIYGSEGTMHLRTHLGPLAVYSEKRSSEGWVLPKFPLEYIPQDLAHKHFIECIIEDKRPICTGEDGKAALKIILAAVESIRTGKSVDIN